MRLAPPTSRHSLGLRLAPADIFWAVLAPFVALALREPSLLDPQGLPNAIPQTYQYALLSIACALGSFLFFRVSESISQFFSVREALNICASVACAVLLTSFFAFTLNRLEGVPRSTPLIYGLVLASGLVAMRIGARLTSRHQTPAHAASHTADFRRVLVIGVDQFSAAAIRLLDSQKPRTTLVVAALDARRSTIGRKISGVKIVGHVRDLNEIIQEYLVHGVAIDEIWLSDSAPVPNELVDWAKGQCINRELPFQKISEAFNLTHPQAPPVTTASVAADEVGGYFRVKRVIDVAGAAVLLTALLPVTLAVAGLTFLDVGAPALFWQQRIGRHGRKFLLYKFRTYHAPYDKDGNPIPEALRLSKIGRAIRATRLDEIPQLYNILIGDMSLIGPRPLLPHDQPKDPTTRLLVRPGITGWAQINGGTSIGPEEKDALDIWYIRHASLALDLRICISTLRVALMGETENHAVLESALQWREKSFSSGTGEASP
ncbi:MAG: sugar transferase [Methylocystis sp.]|uniref:sugar transferase n=1 Tax=Methylocystis sp. TaxID=1911079 RepID=UPI003DA5551E